MPTIYGFIVPFHEVQVALRHHFGTSKIYGKAIQANLHLKQRHS